MDALTLLAKITMDTSEYDKGLKNAESNAKSFGQKLSSGIGKAAKVSAAAVGAVGAAATVAGKALMNNAKEVASYGDNIDKMSQKIGISAEAYQEWDAVFQHSGANVNSLQQGMKTLNTQITKVTDSASYAKSPFKQLGISFEEMQTIAKDPDKALETVISHLQELPAGAERSALATKVLGRSGVELGALFNQTAKDTQEMRDRVHELGGVMSDEAVKASAQFQDNMQDLHTALDGVKRSIMSSTLPAFNDLIDGFTKLIAGEDGAEEAIDKGMTKMSGAIDEIMPKIGNIISTVFPRLLEVGGQIVVSLGQQIPKIISGLGKSIPKIAKTLANGIKDIFPEILKAGVSLVETLADGIENGSGEFIDTIIELIETIFNALVENAPRLIDAGLRLIMALVDGLVNNIDKVVDAILLGLQSLLKAIIEHLPEFLSKGAEILHKLIQGMVDNIPQIVQTIVQVVTTLIQTLVDHLPEILQAGVQILIELSTGLVKAIPELIKAIPQIIQALCDNLLSGDMIDKLLKAGFDIISNIFDGIMSGDFLGTLADIGKALLGAVGAAVGSLISLGGAVVDKILEGIKGAWHTVVSWVTDAWDWLTGSIDVEEVIGNGNDEAVQAFIPGGGKKSSNSGSTPANYGDNYKVTVNNYMGGTNTGKVVADSKKESDWRGSH